MRPRIWSSRLLPAFVSAVITLTLVPSLAAATGATPAAAAAAGAREDSAPVGAAADRVDDIRDVPPGGFDAGTLDTDHPDTDHPDADGADADAAENVPSIALPDSGVARSVTRRAAGGDDVAVIVRLRDQVDADQLTNLALSDGLEAAAAERDLLDAGGLTATEQHRVEDAGENARATAVVESLQQFAEDRRAPVAGLLGDLRADGHAAEVRPYWIFNGFSATVDSAALRRLEQHPGVASVTLDATIHQEQPQAVDGGPKLPTWGLERVKATDVWAEYGNRGQGVVVGIMDSGVDGQHPALAGSWRGRTGDPAKSWFVATNEDYPTPGDGGGHGTHVMGTILGGTPGEVVGVAPEAQWIAAKIFNDLGAASTSGIHRSFEWMLAPGGDPTAAPDVVNNSWGASNPAIPEFMPDVDAWVAAGIVPMFAAGNDGPAAPTVGSPGSFPKSITIGATDYNDVIAGFSSRGPVQWDGVTYKKPDVSAPGHHIFSSYPTDLGHGQYIEASGTSMATPHATGVVALTLAANPNLSVEDVRALLTGTARQERHMGALPDNDYGHGIVNAYAAVTRAAHSATLTGTVTGPTGPVAATLRVLGTDWTTTSTADTGGYQLTVPAGTQKVRVTAHGFRPFEFSIKATAGGTPARDVALQPANSTTLDGTVRSDGVAIAGAEVELVGTGVPAAQTDSRGRFSITAPHGEYQIRVRASGYQPWTRAINLPHETMRITLDQLTTPTRPGWAMYQNSPSRAGHGSATVKPQSLRRAWEVDTGPGITFSSPVIADGKVFIGTNDGELEARDPDTGELVWTYDVGDQLRGTPAVADGAVVVGGGLAGGILAVDASTGELRWRVPTPERVAVYVYPAIDEGVVYAATGPSETPDTVLAIDLATGNVRWSADVGAGVFGAPSVSETMVVVTSAAEQTVTALDKRTGQVRWSVHRVDDTFYGGASIADGLLYLATTSIRDDFDGSVLALDAADGSLVWEQARHGDAQGTTPAIYGDLVIAGTHANGAVVAYDRATGEVAWRHSDSGPISSALMVTRDGYVIGGSQLDHTVFALDAATGDAVWRDTVAGNVTSSAAYDDGTLITADVTGALYGFRSTGRVTGTVTGPDGPIEATVTIGGRDTSTTSDPQTGAYTLDERPGTYLVRASAYGFADASAEASVVAGRTSTVDLTLSPVGNGSVTGVIRDGAGTPLEGVEVGLAGTPLAPTSTGSDGSFAFPRVAVGSYRLTAAVAGFIPFKQDVTVVDGQPTTLDLTLAPYKVAVIGDVEGMLVGVLEELGYPAESTGYAEVTAHSGRYDVVVANSPADPPTDDDVRAFIDATDAAGTSVVWLDTWGALNGSIDHLAAATGDPADVSWGNGSGKVSLAPTVEHPLTEGLPADRRSQLLGSGGWWSAFTGYSGTVVAGLHTEKAGDVGAGIAYQPRTTGSVHVLVASLAAETINRPDEDWTQATAYQVLDNAVGYALDAQYGEVRGTVSDTGGQPLAATVVAVGTGYRTHTGADGGYRLVLEPGSYTLRFRSPGMTPVERTVEVTEGGSQRADAALSQAGLGTLAGAVTDAAGDPVPGATIVLDETNLSATTAADGTYTLTGVPAETYTLRASAGGFFPVTQEVTVALDGTSTADIVLRATPHVGILGDYNSTIANLLEQAGMTSEPLAWSDSSKIGSVDVVVFNDPPNTTAPVFNDWLTLMDQHQVSAVFGDAASTTDGSVRMLRQFTGNPSKPRIEVPDSSGDIRFHAVDPAHPVFAGLGNEPVVLLPNRESAAIDGYTGFPVATVASELGGDHGVGVTYQPRTGESVHLLLGGLTSSIFQRADQDWTPAGRRLFANAVVFGADPALGSVTGTVGGAEGVPVDGTVLVDGTQQRAAMTAGGGYELHLPPGDYTLRFRGFGYDEVTRSVTVADGSAGSVDVTLSPQSDTGSVTGVVTSGGQPVSGATVRLLGTPRQAITEADGSYEIRFVEAGDYDVDITADGYLRERGAVSVAATQAVDHDVSLRESAVVGVIDDFQGKLAAYVKFWGYQPLTITWADTARLAELDVVVANLGSSSGFDPGAASLEEFDEAALRAGVSIVWLDQYARGSFRYLTKYFGDPTGGDEGHDEGAVTATVTAPNHPIMAGLPTSFALAEPEREYSWFDGFTGETLATVASDEAAGGGLVGLRPRGAAGVDILIGTLTVSQYGWPAYGDVAGLGWTEDAGHLLRNAIRYAADAPSLGGQVEGVLRSDAGALTGSVTVVETGRRYTVSGDGSFLIGLPPGTWTLRGKATNYGPADVQVTVSDGDRLSQNVTLILLPNGDITGTVTDESGAPVAGALVAVRETEFTATTGPDGGYLISGIPEGEYMVEASTAGHQTSRAQVTVTADETTPVDLQLVPSQRVALLGDYLGSLRGLLTSDGYTVTEYSSSQLAAMTSEITQYDVVVLDDGVAATARPALTALLDAAAANGVSVVFGGQWGGGAIGDLRLIRNDPQAIDSDFVPNPVSYTPTRQHPIFAGFPVGEPITILADPKGGNQQYLTFDGYSGTTIADVHSDADGANLGHGVGYRYTSRSSVEVLLASLGVGTYGRPGEEWTSDAELIYLNAVAFATNATRGEIAGTVTAGGAPVAKAQVTVTELGSSATTDSAGGYSIGAPDGTYTVEVEALGFERATGQVTVRDAAAVRLDFELTALPRHNLTGTVTDDRGQPVIGATVRGGGVEDWSATTGADGTFTRPGLLAGEYDVTVVADGHLDKMTTVEVEGPTRLDVQLTTIDVAVLGDADGILVGFLRDNNVAAGELDWADATKLAPYDVVIVNGDGGAKLTDAQFDRFTAAAESSEAGVVYTGTWGGEGGIELLEQFTDRVEVGVSGYGQGSVRLTDLAHRHRLFEGMASPATVLGEGSYFATIEEYDGRELAAQAVTETDGDVVRGVGAAYDNIDSRDVEVLLASMAVTGAIGPDLGWTAEGERLMLNAVEFARDPS